MNNLLNDWSNELNPNRNQLIFVGKNQTYGAYVLRKDYSTNLIMALLTTSIVFIGGLFIIQWFAPTTENNNITQNTREDVLLMIEDINLTPEKILPQKNPNSAAAATTNPTPPASNIVPITQVSLTTDPVQTELNPQITPINTTPTTTDPGLVTIPGGTPGSTGTEPPANNPITSNSPLIGSEVMPEFIGGQSALFLFLKNKTQYPASAKEMGQGGVSYVRFVVAKDGSIQNIEILRSGGSAFDKEAIRVISSMPKWKPGLQDGQPVSVYFTIPFRFTLQD